jgi:hypothetical protein
LCRPYLSLSKFSAVSHCEFHKIWIILRALSVTEHEIHETSFSFLEPKNIDRLESVGVWHVFLYVHVAFGWYLTNFTCLVINMACRCRKIKEEEIRTCNYLTLNLTLH